jgi:hypothetical protein
MAKVTSTSDWQPNSQVVSPITINQRANAAQAQSAPGLASAAVAMVKKLLPFLAGGVVILGGIKIIYEKYVVKDPGELRGVRIGFYNLFVVGIMAAVFALGSATVAAWWAKVQSNMTQAAKLAGG